MWENIARRLEGLLVILEPLEARHEEGLFEAAQDPVIWRWIPYNAIETPESFHVWFEDAVAVSKTGTQAAFAILDARTGVPIGSTRYLTPRPEHRGLEIGDVAYPFCLGYRRKRRGQTAPPGARLRASRLPAG